MRKRSQVREDEERAEKPIEIPHDPVNEQVIIAAALVDAQARVELVRKLPRPDFFLVQEHRPVWAAMLELERRKLDYDPATLQQLAGDRVNVEYVTQLVGLRPEAPTKENLAHHVGALYWDRQRAVAVQGPVSLLVEALRRPAEAPERVRALARHVAEALDGGGIAMHLHDGKQVIEDAMADIRRRRAGHACWPYGIEALDRYEEGARDEKGNDLSGRARMVPGAAPGQVTVITAVSGGGKSTMTGHIAIGLAEQKRRVLYGAWEMGSPMTLELLALLDLGWSRTDVSEGRISEEDEEQLRAKMVELDAWVKFMGNPFQRHRDERTSNARNQDVLQQHIEASGCDVFIADLWERCLVSDEPSDEKRALFRQQAMADQTKTHHILLAQQRIKDIETRADKRPTREGIKGSSAWVDIADTILAPHRPALFKNVEDSKLEVIVWKQRHGKWPMVVEFDWDAEFGSIDGGRSIRFEHIGETGGDLGEFIAPKVQSKKRRG